jgi:hypothetical protein
MPGGASISTGYGVSRSIESDIKDGSTTAGSSAQEPTIRINHSPCAAAWRPAKREKTTLRVCPVHEG